MSASSKKKLRKEQNAANMTQKQKAAQKEAKQLKIYTWTFWVVIVLCVSIVAGMALSKPINTTIDRLVTAVVVDGEKLSAAELNYFYVDAINEYCNQYSSYLSYFLDTTKPIGEQVHDEETGATWADAFVDMAVDNIQNTYALYNAAIEAGHKLTEDEQKSVQSLYDNMDVYATYYGYSNANQYLKAVYGNSASEKSYKEYYEVTVMASSYYSAYAQDLKDSYKEVDLRDYEEDKLYEFNSYTYAYHYLNVDNFKTGGTKGEDDKITYSDEEIKAAEDAVKKAAEELAVSDNNTVEKLNTAIEALEKSMAEDKKDESTTEDEEKEEEVKYSTATEQDDVLYSSVNSTMQEWLRDEARKEGDITALRYTTKSTDEDGKETETLKGYYVVLYKSTNDNTYALANVRHVLIAFEGGKTDESTGQTTYTDAEKEKARKEAYDLYDEWIYGEEGTTEESFIELAKKNSDDGNAEEGGLYEDVYPGQMVDTFNDWCFKDGRKAGDHGVVQTEYGYHIMFYSGDSETNYRDYMITNAMLEEDVTEWQDGLIEATTIVEKNTKRVDRDIVLNSGTESQS